MLLRTACCPQSSPSCNHSCVQSPSSAGLGHDSAPVECPTYFKKNIRGSPPGCRIDDGAHGVARHSRLCTSLLREGRAQASKDPDGALHVHQRVVQPPPLSRLPHIQILQGGKGIVRIMRGRNASCSCELHRWGHCQLLLTTTQACECSGQFRRRCALP